MTWGEFSRLTMPLAVQLGAEWDSPTWKLYHRAVESIPLALYASAIKKAAETRSKMPSAAQLRELAEQCRRDILQANPYSGCPVCVDQHGWRVRPDDPEHRVERCDCFHRHQERLHALGVSGGPLALEQGREVEA